jgi:hypothetical protein
MSISPRTCCSTRVLRERGRRPARSPGSGGGLCVGQRLGEAYVQFEEGCFKASGVGRMRGLAVIDDSLSSSTCACAPR